MVTRILLALAIAFGVIGAPTFQPTSLVADNEAQEWREFHNLAYVEHFDAFTAHFESLTYKRSKNGRSMVNGKFVKSV